MAVNPSLSAAITKAVADVTPGLSKRLADGDDVYAEILGAAAQAHEETRRILQASVDSARRAGHSWESIGRLLGVSKQAAQQRFGRLPTVSSETDAKGKMLYPVTALNEMGLLKELGRFGWHSVGFGVRYHRIKLSAEQWEHARVIAAPSLIREFEAQGWQQIGNSSFPWAYFSRSLRTPADDGLPARHLLQLIRDEGFPRR